MTAILERSFKVLEHLVAYPEGRALSALASDLQMPLSATHRLLSELIRCGYVRQDQSHGNYMLTIKLVSLGLSFLSNSGVVDVAQPLLDRLAAESGSSSGWQSSTATSSPSWPRHRARPGACATTPTWACR